MTSFQKYKTIGFVVLFFMFSVSVHSAGIQGYYSQPSLHKEQIVFCAENDLWIVSTKGGLAKRLTRHPGSERHPHISPDGKWVAYMAHYNGDADVYVIPLAGGKPKRLTFQTGPDFALGWTHDSKHVLFRSYRYYHRYLPSIHSVSLEGGVPTKVKLGFSSEISIHADKDKVAFVRMDRAYRTWKRYTGGLAQDIWVGSLSKGGFQQVTQFPGTDSFPMWLGDRLFFLSDRTGVLNLFSMDSDGKNKRQHTFQKKWDVRWPTTDGQRIVFQSGADLFLFHPQDGTTRKIDISLPTDAYRSLSRTVNAAKYLRSYALSNDGKRIVVAVRGKLLNLPVAHKKGVSVQLSHDSSSREEITGIFPDNKTLLVVSDRNGEKQITQWDSKKPNEYSYITEKLNHHLFKPTLSPDGKQLVYGDKFMRLWTMEAKKGAKPVLIHKSPIWELKDYSWSPDSRYIAYSLFNTNTNSSLFLWDTKEKRNIRITSQWNDDSNPTWSTDGKKIFFISRRDYNPFIDGTDFINAITHSHRIYEIHLTSKDKSKEAPEDSFFKEAPAKKKKAIETQKAVASSLPTSQKTKEVSKKKTKKDKKKKVVVIVEEKGIMERIYPVQAIPVGSYHGLTALENQLLFVQRPLRKMITRHGRMGWSILSYSFKTKKVAPFAKGAFSYTTSLNKKFVVVHQKGSFYVAPATGKLPTKGKGIVPFSSYALEIQPTKEWKQILREAWRLNRDFYWANNMAYIPWSKILVQYETLLSRLLTRGDLHDVIGQLIGELGTSHTYRWGGDYPRIAHQKNGLLGAKLAWNVEKKAYQFKKVYQPVPWAQQEASSLSQHHHLLKEGMFLLAINNQVLTQKVNYHKWLDNKAHQNVLLTVNTIPSFKGSKKIVVKAIGFREAEKLRYNEWVESRRQLVEKWSQGKVAYIHIPNMGVDGLVAFYRMWYPQLDKRAMVIDVRSNGGGFVSQMILQRLMRKLYAFFKPSNAKMSMNVPEKTFHGHLAAIADERCGSDGDIFTKSFKNLKLGKVFGKRTWGGVVGMRGPNPFVDWGMMSIPEYAWWNPTNQWSLENSGVEPDVKVENTPEDMEKGFDRQLRETVTHLLKKLAKDPKTLPTLPTFPNKSVPSFLKKWQKWQVPPAK